MTILTYTDPVFDFTDTDRVDLAGLSLLLTARQLAEKDNHEVWLRNLPAEVWVVLYELGLEDYFQYFPLVAGDAQ